MLSRRTIIGSSIALGLVGLVGSVAAYAHGGGGWGRHAMMKRFVSSMIDEALAPANPTPEQRTVVNAARDRAFAAFEAHAQTRKARMDEALALFESSTLDPTRVAVFRAQREAEHKQLGDTITQALTEVHDTLTPVQRKAVADWIRTHRPGHGG